jgi:hypothetical protein
VYGNVKDDKKFDSGPHTEKEIWNMLKNGVDEAKNGDFELALGWGYTAKAYNTRTAKPHVMEKRIKNKIAYWEGKLHPVEAGK